MINDEKMTTDQLDAKIISALRRPSTLRSPDICLADIARTIGVGYDSPFIGMLHILRQLQGRTVERVEWVNVPDRCVNPLSEIGHFEIHLKP